MTDFVHLHVHTHYSMLDSTVKVPALFEKAKKLGMDTVAITDHANLYHCIEAQEYGTKKGVRPIYGCEIYLPPDDVDPGRAKPYHLVLLAETLDGYRNLVELNSRAWIRGLDRAGRPLCNWADLAELHDGLIALSGDLGGEIPQALLRRDFARAEAVARRLVQLMGPAHFYLERQRHGGSPLQQQACDMLVELGERLSISTVATNNVHYLARDDFRAHAVLMCIGLDKRVDKATLDRIPVRDLYLKSPDEMAELFADLPEAIAATRIIAERCQVKIPTGKYFLPRFPVPDTYDEPAWIRELASRGLEARFSRLEAAGRGVDREAYRQRMVFELDCIIAMGFAGYFLIVADFINWAKDHGIPVGPGRGSGAGSIVAWALQITDIDPIPYGLLFERFLNPERVSMPDFDIDFCQDRRGEVIEYVGKKYGADNVGMIVTFGQLKARAVVRDVARVINTPVADADRLAKLIPEELNITLAQAYDKEPRLRDLVAADENVAWIYNIGLALEGNNRNTGMHAAGVVISQEPLWKYVPVMKGNQGELVAQFAKNEVEAAGLVKFDFLGLKTLTVIEDAVKLVNRKRPASDPLNWDTIDVNDRGVYELISHGDTTGVFQLESEGFTKLLRSLKPDCFEDIVAAVALYRPGPLGSGMIEQFIECKHGKRAVEYPHPLTERVLRETYGVMVYQEQVMQTAQVLAGYSLGGADLLRRAMGKKKPEEMEKQRELFVKGAATQGIDAAKAGEIFDLMAHFAGYGFNKSHSAAYALLTFRTGWLKRYHPSEFFAALMTNDASQTDKVARLIVDARERKVRVLPPDVNESERTFTVADGAIRFGLGAVKGIGAGAIEAIVEVRTQKRFTSIFDFCERVDLRRCGKRVLEALVRCGAFDSTFPDEGGDASLIRIGRRRARLTATLDAAVERGQRQQRDAEAGQSNLFDLFAAAAPAGKVDDTYVEARPWDARSVLSAEKEALGFYVSGHPLDRYGDEVRRLTDANSVSIHDKADRIKVRIAAVIASKRERIAKDGKGRIVSVQLEDRYGTIDAVVFPRAWEKCQVGLESVDPVLVSGTVNVEYTDESATRRLSIDDIQPLSEARQRSVTRATLELDATHVDAQFVERLAAILGEHRGAARVAVRLQLGASVAPIDLPPEASVNASDAFIAAVTELVGDDVVRLA